MRFKDLYIQYKFLWLRDTVTLKKNTFMSNNSQKKNQFYNSKKLTRKRIILLVFSLFTSGYSVRSISSIISFTQ